MRHDFVIVNLSGRLSAYGQAREQCPEEWDSHLQELLLERHGKWPIPAIVRRQETEKKGFLQVGWSSWKLNQGIRLRLAVEIPEKTVEMRISPYEVFQMKRQWPESLCGQLTAVWEAGEKYGIEVGLIGAAGMEVLTGMPFLREESDLDLIVSCRSGSSLEDFSSALKEVPGRKTDIELQISGVGGVKLTEWMSDQKTVMVKSLKSIKVYNKSKLSPNGGV